jgi:hypothetical protein
MRVCPLAFHAIAIGQFAAMRLLGFQHVDIVKRSDPTDAPRP